MIVAFDIGKSASVQPFAVEFGIDPTVKKLKFNSFFKTKRILKRFGMVLEMKLLLGEVVGKRLSGEAFDMFISVATMRDEEVRWERWVWVEITDLKIAEEELKASEERYRDILDNALDIIFVIVRTDLLFIQSLHF